MTEYRKRRDVLQELYSDENLVNGAILTADGGIIKVHFELLAAVSSFFKKLIIAQKDGKDTKHIFIPEVSNDTMLTIVNYIYTGKLIVSLDGVNDLVTAAGMLRIPSVLGLCKKYLSDNLSCDRCIGILKFAQHYNLEDLEESANMFMLLNFQQVFLKSDFLHLSLFDVQKLISHDSLCIKSEEYVFWAIMRWVEYNLPERYIHLASLLRCVRLGLVDFQFYQNNICIHPLISTNDECQAILFQASMLFMDINNEAPLQPLVDVNHPFIRPRVPAQIVFVFGGWSAGSAINVLETYDCKSNRWYISNASDTMTRAYHGMIFLKGNVYIIGGFDGNTCFNCVRCFNPTIYQWEERACMYVARCYVSVAATNGQIYALGGYDGHQRNGTAERYDPEMNQWYMIAEMHNVRSDASADSLDGKIYIAGGFNGESVMNTAEFYNPETNTWTLITNMLSPRSGVKLVAFENSLFVIGGFNGTTRLSTVEKYDPSTRQWCLVPSLHAPRSNFATAVLEGRLYAIGGFNGLTTVQTVECYDSEKNLWQKAADLNLNRSALAACVVHGVPNLVDYSHIGYTTDPNR